jgi:hypothetical protein
MSSRNTFLFSSVLLAATVAIVADYRATTYDAEDIPPAPQPVKSANDSSHSADDEAYAPCGAR